MESGNKIVSANSTEPSCEFATSSSQNFLPGGNFLEVNADMACSSTEPTCELAASSSLYTLLGSSSRVCLREEDLPVASLNRCQPSHLHILKLKSWLNCRDATKLLGRSRICEEVSKLYNSAMILIPTSHSSIWCSVCDYITAGLDTKIVDPDGGIHSSHLWSVHANQVVPIPSVLIWRWWTYSL